MKDICLYSFPSKTFQPFPTSLHDLLEQSLPFYNMLKRHARRSSYILNSTLPHPSLPVPANEKLLVWVGDEIVPRETAKVKFVTKFAENDI